MQHFLLRTHQHMTRYCLKHIFCAHKQHFRLQILKIFKSSSEVKIFFLKLQFKNTLMSQLILFYVPIPSIHFPSPLVLLQSRLLGGLGCWTLAQLSQCEGRIHPSILPVHRSTCPFLLNLTVNSNLTSFIFDFLFFKLPPKVCFKGL